MKYHICGLIGSQCASDCACNCYDCNGARPDTCHDCGVDTGKIREYYMVTSEVWEASGVPELSHLCIGCLEQRLGRRLMRTDFTRVPMNNGPVQCYSKRLQGRLGLGREQA